MRVVVAAFGNVLRRDDGFGPVVLETLCRGPVPEGVVPMEVGIGGMHLVQHLMGRPADVLIVLDAVEVGRPPGTLVVVATDPLDVRGLPAMEQREHLADVHYATPDRALMLLRALDALPAITATIGCEPLDADTPVQGLTDVVARAVDPAAAEVRRMVRGLGVPWPEPEAP